MQVEPRHPRISISRQCELLDISRSGYYYPPCGETPENLKYMRLIDEQYLRTPFFGSRQMTTWLRREGHPVNRKRIQRLMQLMGLQASVPGPHTSKSAPEHTIYPYLLKDMTLTHANLVWSSDLTYIPMPTGFMYLVAVIDWYSRYVVAWELSNTMDVYACQQVLEASLAIAEPVIFNTDQGSQFTSPLFTQPLLERDILISMDGRGRALDNVFVERLWRSVKYEDIYLKDYQSVAELNEGLNRYFEFYNHERPHSSLEGQTPAQVHARQQVNQWY